jgi:hypothetical protein
VNRAPYSGIRSEERERVIDFVHEVARHFQTLIRKVLHAGGQVALRRRREPHLHRG